MASQLFNKYKNLGQGFMPSQNKMNILTQLAQVQKNPGYIIDILLQSGKINQQQYQELQQYKNNPQAIAEYLMNHGNADAINQAKQQANNFNI